MTEAELEEIRALGHLGMKPGACSGGEECRFRGAIDDLIGEIERLRGVVERGMIEVFVNAYGYVEEGE